MTWRYLAIVVCACGGTTPVATTPALAGPPYMALFERKATWTLPLLATSGQGATASKRDEATLHCAVVSVTQIGDAHVSRLKCDKPHDDLLISGTWVGEPAGLYHPPGPITEPDDLATLSDDDLLLNAQPVERQHSHALEAAQDSIEAFRFDAAWCVRETTVAGAERRSFTLCFDAKGITGGSELTFAAADNAWHRVVFGKIPPDSDDPAKLVEDRD